MGAAVAGPLCLSAALLVSKCTCTQWSGLKQQPAAGMACCVVPEAEAGLAHAAALSHSCCQYNQPLHLPCLLLRYAPAVLDILSTDALARLNSSFALPWQLYEFAAALASLDASFFAATARMAQDASLLQLAAQALGAGQWRYSLRQRYLRARQEQVVQEGLGAAEARLRQLFRKKATIEARRQQQEEDLAAGRLAALLGASANSSSTTTTSTSSDGVGGGGSDGAGASAAGGMSNVPARHGAEVLGAAGGKQDNGAMGRHGHGVQQAAGSGDNIKGAGGLGGTAGSGAGYQQPAQSMLGASCGWVGLEVSNRGG